MYSVRVLPRHILSFLLTSCLLVTVGCSSSPTGPAAESTPRSQSAQWESISLPISGTQLLSYAVSPADPSSIYACTLAPQTIQGQSSENTVVLWHTHDAGRHWTLISLPETTGSGCSISIAPSQSQRIAFLVSDYNDFQRPCDRDSLYLSNDSGSNWQRISLYSIAPLGASYDSCFVSVTNHHLYMWYTFVRGKASPQQDLLQRTDDDSATWFRIDDDFGPDVFFGPPQVGSNDRLAVIVRHSRSNYQTGSVLWMSHDAGSTWQRIGNVSSSVGTYLLTSYQPGSSWPSVTDPFYALANEQIPSDLYRLQVFQSANGQHWSTIPPLPVPGAGVTSTGLLQALATTANGHFLAFGVNPRIGVPLATANEQRPITTFWLWMWDPRTLRWQVLSTPLNHTADESCGLCWSAFFSSGPDNTAYLYVYHWGDSDHLFRVRLPTD